MILRTSKASGITPWKKCYSLLRWLRYKQDAQQTFTVQQPKSRKLKPSPIISSFLNWAEENYDAAKTARRRNKKKQKLQQTFVETDCSVLLLRAFIPAGKRAYCSQYCTSCPSMGNLSHCSTYFWVPSSCFCIGLRLFWGWNNPVQRCLPVGGRLHYPRRGGGGGFTHWLTDCFDVRNRRRPAATSSRRASFSALARQSLLAEYIERSNITLTHLHAALLRSPASFFVLLSHSWAL